MTTADGFLLDALANGPRAASDLISEARDVGISPRQLRRARERLCAPPEQAGRRWHWKLEEGGERTTRASVIGRDAMEPEHAMERRPGERQAPLSTPWTAAERVDPMDDALKVVTSQGRDAGQHQAPPPGRRSPLETDPSRRASPMEPDQLMEGAIDWQDVGVQVPPPPAVGVMEPEGVMEATATAAAPERQAPRPRYEGDHEICEECGRMTCGVCLSEIPAHRARAHREGRDGARPECPLQDVRAIALARERPRNFAEQLFGVMAS